MKGEGGFFLSVCLYREDSGQKYVSHYAFRGKEEEKWGLIGLTDIMCSVPYFISYQLLSFSELCVHPSL